MLHSNQFERAAQSITHRDQRGSRGEAPVQVDTPILIIDDDRLTGKALAAMLNAAGYDDVRAVRSAERAMTVAEALRPAIVFLDIDLPAPGGYDLALRMQRNARLRAMRLIALTGNVVHGTREEARAAGFERFLVKPVMQVELDKILRRPTNASK